MHQRTARRRIKPQSVANWCSNAAIQLDFIAEIDDNDRKTGAVVVEHQSLPNQEGGSSSTMTATNLNPTTANPQPRKTYPQDWPAYNAAQTSEKDTFMVLLADLCANIPQPEYSFGRPRFPLADMVYTGTTKVYAGFSARRFDCDVRDACRKDFISTPP